MHALFYLFVILAIFVAWTNGVTETTEKPRHTEPESTAYQSRRDVNRNVLRGFPHRPQVG